MEVQDVPGGAQSAEKLIDALAANVVCPGPRLEKRGVIRIEYLLPVCTIRLNTQLGDGEADHRFQRNPASWHMGTSGQRQPLAGDMKMRIHHIGSRFRVIVIRQDDIPTHVVKRVDVLGRMKNRRIATLAGNSDDLKALRQVE